MPQYIDKPGTFLCKVIQPINGWFGEQGDNNTPYIRLPLVVDDPDDEQHGREIIYQAWLSDKAVERTSKNLAEVFGWDGDMEKLARGEPVFTGMTCRIVCESEDYNGKARIKVKWLNSAGGGGKKMEPDKISSLVSHLEKRTKAAVLEAPRPRAATPDPDLDAEGDDVPF